MTDRVVSISEVPAGCVAQVADADRTPRIWTFVRWPQADDQGRDTTWSRGDARSPRMVFARMAREHKTARILIDGLTESECATVMRHANTDRLLDEVARLKSARVSKIKQGDVMRWKDVPQNTYVHLVDNESLEAVRYAGQEAMLHDDWVDHNDAPDDDASVRVIATGLTDAQARAIANACYAPWRWRIACGEVVPRLDAPRASVWSSSEGWGARLSDGTFVGPDSDFVEIEYEYHQLATPAVLVEHERVIRKAVVDENENEGDGDSITAKMCKWAADRWRHPSGKWTHEGQRWVVSRVTSWATAEIHPLDGRTDIVRLALDDFDSACESYMLIRLGLYHYHVQIDELDYWKGWWGQNSETAATLVDLLVAYLKSETDYDDVLEAMSGRGARDQHDWSCDWDFRVVGKALVKSVNCTDWGTHARIYLTSKFGQVRHIDRGERGRFETDYWPVYVNASQYDVLLVHSYDALDSLSVRQDAATQALAIFNSRNPVRVQYA